MWCRMPSRRGCDGHGGSQCGPAGVGAGGLMRNPEASDGAVTTVLPVAAAGGVTVAVTGAAAGVPGGAAAGATSAGTRSVPATVHTAGVPAVPPHFLQPLLKTPFHNRARAL